MQSCKAGLFAGFKILHETTNAVHKALCFISSVERYFRFNIFLVFSDIIHTFYFSGRSFGNIKKMSELGIAIPAKTLSYIIHN